MPETSELLAYYRWLCERTNAYIGQRVLVAGPACWEIAFQLGSRRMIVGVDREQQPIEIFNKRFIDTKHFHARQCDLSNSESLTLSQFNLDTVFCVNALERTASDSMALQHIHDLLSQEGYAIFLVPALPRLSKWLDPTGAVRHRYSKSQILQKLDQHRFHVVDHFYFNSMGLFFPSHRTYLDRRSMIDRLAANWNIWETKIRPPLGRSLVVIARKKLPARG